jgi:CheY-like chemotaxis protein
MVRIAPGLEEEVDRSVRVPVGRGVAGHIAAEGKPLIIEDVDRAEILKPFVREHGVRSLLGVPLLIEGRLIGILQVGSLRPRRFTPDADALSRYGATVKTAASAGEGLELLRRWPPDLLIVDIGMPFQDGYDFLRRARAELRSDLPAVALTAYAGTPDRERVRREGFLMHLARPSWSMAWRRSSAGRRLDRAPAAALAFSRQIVRPPGSGACSAAGFWTAIVRPAVVLVLRARPHMTSRTGH